MKVYFFEEDLTALAVHGRGAKARWGEDSCRLFSSVYKLEGGIRKFGRPDVIVVGDVDRVPREHLSEIRELERQVGSTCVAWIKYIQGLFGDNSPTCIGYSTERRDKNVAAACKREGIPFVSVKGEIDGSINLMDVIEQNFPSVSAREVVMNGAPDASKNSAPAELNKSPQIGGRAR